MIGVLELVKKNLKNLIRSKASSLIVILGPLVVIFLAGLAFDNSNVYAVKVGAFTPNSNELTSKLLDNLRTQFKVIEYNTENECSDAIKNGDINTCMIFSSDFTLGVPSKNQLQFYVDYSRINLVYAVTRAMTEKIGEQSLEASENLTKTLLDALDYTQKRIANERELLVKLSTENELIKTNTGDLQAELGDINLQFDESEFPLEDIAHSKTQVKQWVDSALTLSDKGLSKATSFIDSADALVKNSAASTDTKNALLLSFQKAVDDIKALKGDFSTTKNLTQQSFVEFDQKMIALTQTIGLTKQRLQEADTSRQFSLRILESIQVLLDKSLISVLFVQQALNDIDKKINAIEIKDASGISQPIVTTIKPIVQEKTYLNYLFPVLIVLVVMFTSLLMTPTLILLDRNSPGNIRAYLTPVKDWAYVASHFITAFLLLFTQVIIILAIVSIFFAKDLLSNVPKAFILLTLISALFVLIGMIIGYLFKSEETATLFSVSLGAIFLFISDVIIPLESMPEAFAYIASFNPYVLGSSLLRRALIYNSPFTSLLQDTLILIGYILATALIATGTYLLTRNYTLQEIIKNITPVLQRIKRKKK